MRQIFISPHLDDAVLSVGGLIHAQNRSGLSPMVWTIMAGMPPNEVLSPLAQQLHDTWGLDSAREATHIRRKEDNQALKPLGAQVLHYDFLDCIYRRDKQGIPLYDDIFLPLHPEDDDLGESIMLHLGSNLHPDDQLYCPLGIGMHVDHLHVRRSVGALGFSMRYYADIP